MSVIALNSFAQDNNPVSWKINKKKTGSLIYELRIKANIQEPWHIYPLKDEEAAGVAMPTEIIFEECSNVELIGSTRVEKQDKGKTANYSGEVTFVQTIKLKTKEKTVIDLIVKYMACTDQMCLPPTSQKFSLKIR